MGGVLLNLNAEEKDIEKLKEEIVDKGLSISSYHAFSTATWREDSKWIKTEANIFFDQEKGLRMEGTLILPRGKTLKHIFLITKETYWEYAQAERKVKFVDLKKVREEIGEKLKNWNPARKFDLRNPFSFDGIQAKTVTFSGEGEVWDEPAYIFEAKFLSSLFLTQSPTLYSGKMWVSKKTGLIKKILLYSEKGEEICVQDYDPIIVGISISPDKFTFSPPPEVEKVDLTEKWVSFFKNQP